MANTSFTVRFSPIVGAFVASSPFISLGTLAIGATEAEATAKAEAELSRRFAAGKPALAAVRASGRVVAAFAQARKELATF